MSSPRAALTLLCLLTPFLATAAAPSPTLPALKVSADQRFLVTETGAPFFYLGDTAWELFHRATREEAIAYLDTRRKQRFNVVQAVALAELDGLTAPNAYGDLPLVDLDPLRPAITPGSDPRDATAYDYWDHVDFIVTEANRRGLYLCLLPTWGSWAPHDKKQDPNIIFDAAKAEKFGEFLARRYRGHGVIWAVGGDRLADGVEEIWRAMARGIARGASDRADDPTTLITFHPRGSSTSSKWFHDDAWLSFNMHQTGHSPVLATHKVPRGLQRIVDDYHRTPTKPVMDGEPLYEDHPVGFREARQHGYSFDAHIRQRAYWHIFAGAFGIAYGHHSVWQMYAPGRRGINGPIVYWQEALERPGATQMRHLRALMESRPMLDRVPDQSLVVDALTGPDYITATRGKDYAFIYSAQGRVFTANLGKISGEHVNAWWFNPRNGAAEKLGTFANTGTREFTPHLHGGFGTDAVLVLDDATKSYPAPGTAR